eukprot:TRINITY_DN27601_c0_g1_i2.p1 TRINITY_DN27601_c0_g1~~TRINITY_DN27601_c0_g1_i2.p1  ORF type:complete len:407 (+),score=73.93 TRINITY_DN27601_c0_g1_i2:81-1223(+)
MFGYVTAPLQWVRRVPVRPAAQWVTAALQPRSAKDVAAATADTDWQLHPVTGPQRQELVRATHRGPRECEVIHRALQQRLGPDSGVNSKVKALRLTFALLEEGAPPFRALCTAPGGLVAQLRVLLNFEGGIDGLTGDASGAEVRRAAGAALQLLQEFEGGGEGHVVVPMGDFPLLSQGQVDGPIAHRITGGGGGALPPSGIGAGVAAVAMAPLGWGSWLWRAVARRDAKDGKMVLAAYPADSPVHALSAHGVPKGGDVRDAICAITDPALGTQVSVISLEGVAPHRGRRSGGLREGERGGAAARPGGARGAGPALQEHGRGERGGGRAQAAAVAGGERGPAGGCCGSPHLRGAARDARQRPHPGRGGPRPAVLRRALSRC